MADPTLWLLGGSGVGAGMVFVAGRRVRRPQDAPRIAPETLGLERLPPRGVFVQYSSPASAASRISLNRLAAAVAPHRSEVSVIELRAPLAAVRGTPTVLYVAPDGTVLRRWSGPPERRELEEALAHPAAVATSRPRREGRGSPGAVRSAP
jgi:hypothetical protein